MDVPKSDFQDAAGAKVHFLEHLLEQTFRLFLRVDLVKRKKQTQVQTEMTKKHSLSALQTSPKTHWP